MPALGLQVDPAAEYGIYVLGCKPGHGTAGVFYYVGLHAWATLPQRVGVQFDGGRNQSHYCKTNKPISVELVWPACSRAVEAYMFYALLAKQDAGWERRGAKRLCPVGGFTQNDSVLSPLASVVYEQARRQLKSFCCYNCGGSHTARECKKPKRGLNLTCPQCKADVEMTSKGQTVVATTQHSAVAIAGASSSQRGVKRSAPPAPPAAAAKSSRLPAAPSAKTSASSRNSNRVVVSVCGRHYASLAWFFCKDNLSPSLCERARQKCASNALELMGGHTRSVKAEFSVRYLISGLYATFIPQEAY